MEQVWFLGVLTILGAGINVLRQIIRLESHKVRQFKKVLRYQLGYFLRYDYKLWVLPLLSLFVFYLTKDFVRVEVLQIFFWTNVAWCFATILLSRLFAKKQLHFIWQILFFENAPLSWGVIWGALLINTYLLHQYHTFFGNQMALLALLSCIFLGLGFVLFAYRWWQYGAYLHPSQIENRFISNERLELLITALLSVLMLSQIYGNHSNFALMPLTLTIALISIFTIANFLPFQRFANAITALAAALIVSKWILDFYLPATWFKDGKDYYRSDLFYSIALGLLLSFFADKLIHFYKFLQEKYTYYFLDKPLFHKIATYTIRGFITMCLVILISWGILYAYKNLELYGLILLLIVIFANINSKISFDIPAKHY
ncbi:MAG: hypothetical protein OHK0045_17930 [Raineya sp.]